MKIRAEYFGNPDDCVTFDSSDEEKIKRIIESLENLDYIKKNNTRYKIIKTPWDL